MAKKAPEIRFRGFTEDWEQRKLKNVGNIVTGSTPSTFDKNNYSGSYPFVSPADIQYNRYVDNTITTLSEKGFRKGRVLKEGAVLFVSIGSTIGKVAQVRQEVVTNQQINAILPYENYSEDFIYSSLVKESERIKLLAATQAVPIINKTTFSNVEIGVTENIKEQTKIGNFFKNVDKIIALHQRKLEALQQLKKGLLQKTFPAGQEKVPELRFANFAEDWEQRRFKDFVSINSGRDYKHLEAGDVPVYGTGGYMLSVSDKLSERDSIGIGRKGTIDKPQLLKAPFWTVDTLFFMTPRPGFDLPFLYSMTQKINWKKMDESTGVPSLSKAVIEKVQQKAPKYQEQIKVGEIFITLDKAITLHQRKLEELKSLKKSLLQKMFV